MEWPHLIEQSLRAHVVYEREKDYVAMDNKIVIVDEFTGRLMHGRQWSDGLHQAVEAKEGVRSRKRRRPSPPSPCRTSSSSTKSPA